MRMATQLQRARARANARPPKRRGCFSPAAQGIGAVRWQGGSGWRQPGRGAARAAARARGVGGQPPSLGQRAPEPMQEGTHGTACLRAGLSGPTAEGPLATRPPLKGGGGGKEEGGGAGRADPVGRACTRAAGWKEGDDGSTRQANRETAFTY
ncbi:MAG: hypothetical protein J3K34DRAFT_115411 [Monoraphidium minutum]|nr:MAG: hypothetical protein J3K34DRAFT_115411 [Monoraphidium minutum]